MNAMLSRVAVVAAAVPLVAACSGGTDGGGSQIVTGRESGPYISPTQIIERLNDGGVACKVDGRPFRTLYSDRSQHCLIGHKMVTVAVYASDSQLDDAKAYLPDVDPAAVFVFGDQWSVDVDDEALAHQIQTVLG